MTAENGVRSLLSITSDIGGEKGNLAKLIFCFFVVLQVANVTARGFVTPFVDIGFFDHCVDGEHQGLQWLDASGYVVLCKNVLDMSARIDRAAQSFLRIFVKPDQTYDFESNLLNIDHSAGADIAFLVRNKVTFVDGANSGEEQTNGAIR